MRAPVAIGGLGAVALVFIGAAAPAQIVRIYVLGLLAVAAGAVTRRTLLRFATLGRKSPSRDFPAKPQLPAFFDRGIRRVELANASGVYLEQLRPRFREIAEQRLAARGLRLNTATARELLGEEAWDVLDRPQPGDKFAPPPEGRLRRVITVLERI